MKMLICRLIFFFIIICLSSIATAEIKDYQNVVIITSNSETFDKNIKRNLKSIYSTVKLNHRFVDANTAELSKEISTMNAEEDLLIIAMADSDDIALWDAVDHYVDSGGKLFIISLGAANAKIKKITGIIKANKSYASTGFNPLYNIFPGITKTPFTYGYFSSNCLDVELSPSAKVLINTDKNKPMVWKYKYGKGECLVVNSELLGDYAYSGLLLNLNSMLNDYFLYTVFNAKVVFIDDFPMPIPTGSEFSITEEYGGRSYYEFYRDIWWPQIYKLAQKNGIKYTCLALGNYDNSVEMPPEKLSDKTITDMRYYAKSILEKGNELGIHGYNHASLMTDEYKVEMEKIGYTPWKSIKDMEASLTMLKNTLDKEIGEYKYFSYVPPMNMLSRAGKKAVLDVFPTIRCIAGLGDPFAKERGILHQDIGLDPDFPDVYDLPRFSDGYLYSRTKMHCAFEYISGFGIFSHFFHPDDLLDPERCHNKNWKGLYSEISRIFDEVTEKCPFLRGMTAREFVEEQFKNLKTKVYSHRNGNNIYIHYDGFGSPLYHYLRINNGMKIRDITNGRFEQIKGADNLYLIEGLSSPVTIKLESIK